MLKGGAFLVDGGEWIIVEARACVDGGGRGVYLLVIVGRVFSADQGGVFTVDWGKWVYLSSGKVFSVD